jgi:hypothetical protein
MVEQWNPSSLYVHYWQECAPTYCTYSETVHTLDFSGIMVTIISMVGGLIAVLRVITPRVINFLCNLFKPTVRMQQQGNC